MLLETIMRMLVLQTATALLLSAGAAIGFDPGEQVVLINRVGLDTITGSTVTLRPGMTATVREVTPERLKIAIGRVGWISPTAVIPARDAEDYWTKRIDGSPGDATALLARGTVRLEKAGLDVDKIQPAILDFNRSLEMRPTSDALTLRGYGYKRMGDKDQAMADFNLAIQRDPENALAWRIRGATWAGKGDYGKALADYSESIRVDPENPDSLHHRVVLQSGCMDEQFRNGAQAVKDATKACEVSEWKTPLYLNGLAFAYAEVGDFDAAVKWQAKAMELASKPSPAMQANLEQFRAHKPFRTTWK